MSRRVLVWSHTVIPGSETFIRNQLDSMQRWDPVLVGLASEKSPLSRPADRALLDGSGLVARIRRKLVKITGRSKIIRHEIERQRPDLVHAHFISDALNISRSAKAAGLPLLVTAHGFDVTSWAVAPGPSGWLRRRRIRRLAADAHFVAVSEFIREALVNLGVNADRVHLRYIGIPIGGSAERAEPTTDLLFVGRLTAKKGVRDLLEAAARSTTAPGPRVTIVGDGPLRQELATLARTLGVDAEFAGSVPPEEVKRLMATARVFVAPSQTAPDGDSEGFGMVFLEASLAATPIVAYRHGGVSESVKNGESGLLVAEGSVPALADAIDRLLGDPSLAGQLGSQGRARVIHEFDIQQLTAHLEDLYDFLTTDG